MKPKNIHYHFHPGSGLPAILSRLETLMTTVQELGPQIETLTAQVAKIGTETRSLITKVQDLTDALASTPVPAEVEAALLALGEQVAVVDALVPDEAPAP
jgi:prefoldin subunit 5